MTDDSSRKVSASAASGAGSVAAAGAGSAAAAAAPAERRASGAKGGAKGGSDYNAESIQILEGLEAVRKRPGHVHRLDRRARAPPPRLGGRRQLDRRGDGRLRHPDHGPDRGRRHGHASRTTAAACPSASTRAGSTPSRSSTRSSTPAAKFEQGGYKVSGGLHGVGVSVVNALSEWMRVESSRDGFIWSQEYVRGKPSTKVIKVGPAGTRRGTKTSFRADPEMFQETDYSFDTISQRLRESAYLNKRRLDHVHRRAQRSRAVVLLRRRPDVLRPAHEPEQGGRSPSGRSTSSARRARPSSRWPSSTTTRTPRTCWPSPTTSTRSTAGPMSPASGQRSRARSTTGPARPGSSRTPTRT